MTICLLQDIQGWECKNTSLRYNIHQLEKQKEKLGKLLQTLKQKNPKVSRNIRGHKLKRSCTFPDTSNNGVMNNNFDPNPEPWINGLQNTPLPLTLPN